MSCISNLKLAIPIKTSYDPPLCTTITPEGILNLCAICWRFLYNLSKAPLKRFHTDCYKSAKTASSWPRSARSWPHGMLSTAITSAHFSDRGDKSRSGLDTAWGEEEDRQSNPHPRTLLYSVQLSLLMWRRGDSEFRNEERLATCLVSPPPRRLAATKPVVHTTRASFEVKELSKGSAALVRWKLEV